MSITSGLVRSWLLMSLRSASQIQFACVAAEPSVTARCLPPRLNTALAAQRHAPKEGGQACASSAPTLPHRTARDSQSVVGASRRLSGQKLGAATKGSAAAVHLPAPARLSRATQCLARSESTSASQDMGASSRVWRQGALSRAMPNYSIERTSQGLRPCAASHVKR